MRLLAFLLAALLCVFDEVTSEPLRFRAVKSNKTKTETGSKPR